MLSTTYLLQISIFINVQFINISIFITLIIMLFFNIQQYHYLFLSRHFHKLKQFKQTEYDRADNILFLYSSLVEIQILFNYKFDEQKLHSE